MADVRSDRVPRSSLPVEASIPALRRALADEGHAVLRASPGAGKTTLVPLRLLDEPWLAGRRIVVLEPRRVATRAAARRMAQLLGEDVGATVGYRTGDDRRIGRSARIEVITEGILTRRLQHDPSLPGVGLVVFDEIHERNLHADLALALTLDARAAFVPDLRLLAMSATVDTARFAALLGGDDRPAPTIESEGRAHPIDIRWRPPTAGEDLTEVVGATILEALEHDEGDLLVFLAGAGDIRRVERQLTSLVPPDVDVRPLFGALSAAAQDLALAPSPPGRRRVVLSTDIAETSLTVDGVRIVVDSGLVRTPHYDPRTGMTRLRTGPTARSSADQRAGRAGRTAPGVAYRSWSPTSHQLRAPFPDPEVRSVDLTSLALELAAWGAEADDLSFVDPPPAPALADGRELLVELGALDRDHRITTIGRAMVELPVHPRLARMVLAAVEEDEAPLACTLAALLESRDIYAGSPRERPADLGERVRIVTGAVTRPASVERTAVEAVRRQAQELGRRVQVDAGDLALGSSAASTVGRLLAAAYPDRLAQARGGGRYRLRHGLGAALPPNDGLSDEPFLVVAEIGTDGRAGGGGDHRILRAAGIERSEVEAVAGEALVAVTSVGWDARRRDVRRRTELRLDALVLEESDGPAPPGPATAAVLAEQAAASDLALLSWSEEARSLQARVAFVRSLDETAWPDLSTATLTASADDWLAPHLVVATSRSDLEAIDLAWVLRDLLGRDRLARLDRLAPKRLTLDNGQEVRLDYDDGTPAVERRAQDLYGTASHPTVADGQVPVLVRVLSPAGRPVQVTADLPGFWAGSWSDVRKEMAGRYPKHDWPIDPLNAGGSGPRSRRAR